MLDVKNIIKTLVMGVIVLSHTFVMCLLNF